MAKGDKGGDSSSPGISVEVLVDNLGPKLLKAGTITDDPEIVALLDDPRGFVREVK